ncbi:MAG: sigma-54-dependent Fis family transcriptional regulator [Phycisphaerales bacterium]|nr:MAG: sigma-54-dependent Fis family transcriptional regulator [Phycisphaerales bacterium]
MANVCIVDDKEIIRESLTEALTREEHRVRGFKDPVEAVREMRSQSVDLVITDLRMPKMDGIALMKELRQAGVEVPMIMMTAYASVPTAVEAMKLGAYDYIQKPFSAEEICILVERALQHGALRRENEALRESLRDADRAKSLVGSSAVFAEVRDKIERMANSNATVLIQGESGTGKELVARAIHQASPRADRPLLCLNCPALSSQLLESELFGHERGAFTGADRLRKGRFELADGGTLLLDEISEMDLPLQAKLLRVLQEGQFERVGASVTRNVDVRVVATTNRELARWVREGRFREDLYFRLSVLPLMLPPLRERCEDIPELAAYFLDRIVRQDGRTRKTFDDQALEIMATYSWPGNVRELENICQRASVLATENVIEADIIRPWLSAGSTQDEAADAGPATLRPGHLLEDMERNLIERTLVRFNGHRAKTAKALGIGIRTLGMKLKKWREEARQAG